MTIKLNKLVTGTVARSIMLLCLLVYLGIDIIVDNWGANQTQIEIVDFDDESDSDGEDEENEREKEEVKKEGDENCYINVLCTSILSYKSNILHLQIAWKFPGLETITPPPENTMC